MSGNAKTSITLTSLHCITGSGGMGSDDVYMKYSIDGGRDTRYPASGNYEMDDGDTWSLDIPLSFTKDILVTTYDQDFGGDDFLNSFTIDLDNVGSGSQTNTNEDNDAEYTLNWSTATS